MKKFLRIIYNIIRGISRVTAFFILLLVTKLIWLITYEPNAKKKITPRKARRIRVLSKFKFYSFKIIPEPILSFFGIEDYKNYFNKHLENGLQLRNNGTNRRVV